MSVEINMSLVLTLLVAFLLTMSLIVWRRSGARLKNLVFAVVSIIIVASWVLIIYVIIHFGPALAK